MDELLNDLLAWWLTTPFADDRMVLMWSTGVIALLSPFIALLLLNFRNHRARVYNAVVVMVVGMIALRFFGQIRYGDLLGWWVTTPYLALAVLWVLGLVVTIQLTYRDRRPPTK